MGTTCLRKTDTQRPLGGDCKIQRDSGGRDGKIFQQGRGQTQEGEILQNDPWCRKTAIQGAGGGKREEQRA